MKIVPTDRFHRLFYPQVAAVVTSASRDEIGGLLASSVMPTSFNPPMVAVAFGKGHKTTKLVEESRAFAVNWLSYDNLSAMEKLAQPTPAGVKDKLSVCGLNYRRGDKTGAPILLQAAAYLECGVSWRRESGDHILYIGEVLEAMAIDDFCEYWRFEIYKPVLYIGSARTGWPKFLKFPPE